MKSDNRFTKETLVPAPPAERAKAANYTPPPFKLNDWLEGLRDPMLLLMIPEKTAFIIIDMQNVFTEEGAPWFVPVRPEVFTNINRLAGYCREHNIPVIWVQATCRRDASNMGMHGKYWPPAQPPLVVPDSHWWQLDPRLDNKDADIYVRKPKYNAFWASDLEAVLRGLRVESLIFAGADTEVCIHQTLTDAYTRDFNCVTAMDATGSCDVTGSVYDEKQGWFTLVEQMWSRILTTYEIIAELEALAP